MGRFFKNHLGQEVYIPSLQEQGYNVPETPDFLDPTLSDLVSPISGAGAGVPDIEVQQPVIYDEERMQFENLLLDEEQNRKMRQRALDEQRRGVHLDDDRPFMGVSPRESFLDRVRQQDEQQKREAEQNRIASERDENQRRRLAKQQQIRSRKEALLNSPEALEKIKAVHQGTMSEDDFKTWWVSQQAPENAYAWEIGVEGDAYQKLWARLNTESSMSDLSGKLSGATRPRTGAGAAMGMPDYPVSDPETRDTILAELKEEHDQRELEKQKRRRRAIALGEPLEEYEPKQFDPYSYETYELFKQRVKDIANTNVLRTESTEEDLSRAKRVHSSLFEDERKSPEELEKAKSQVQQAYTDAVDASQKMSPEGQEQFVEEFVSRQLAGNDIRISDPAVKKQFFDNSVLSNVQHRAKVKKLTSTTLQMSEKLASLNKSYSELNAKYESTDWPSVAPQQLGPYSDPEFRKEIHEKQKQERQLAKQREDAFFEKLEFEKEFDSFIESAQAMLDDPTIPSSLKRQIRLTISVANKRRVSSDVEDNYDFRAVNQVNQLNATGYWDQLEKRTGQELSPQEKLDNVKNNYTPTELYVNDKTQEFLYKHNYAAALNEISGYTGDYPLQILRAIGEGFSGFIQGGAGIPAALGVPGAQHDAVKLNETLNKWGEGFEKYTKQTFGEGRSGWFMGLKPQQFRGVLSSMYQSFTLGGLGIGWRGIGAGFGVNEFGRAFAEGRGEGMSHGSASLYAGLMGSAEALPAMVLGGTNKWAAHLTQNGTLSPSALKGLLATQKSLKDLTFNATKTLGTELVEESLTTIAQTFVDGSFIHEDENFFSENIGPALLETAETVFAQTALMGGVGGLGEIRRGRRYKKKLDQRSQNALNRMYAKLAPLTGQIRTSGSLSDRMAEVINRISPAGAAQLRKLREQGKKISRSTIEKLYGPEMAGRLTKLEQREAFADAILGQKQRARQEVIDNSPVLQESPTKVVEVEDQQTGERNVVTVNVEQGQTAQEAVDEQVRTATGEAPVVVAEPATESPSQRSEWDHYVNKGEVRPETVDRLVDKIATGQKLTQEEIAMREGAAEEIEARLQEKAAAEAQPTQEQKDAEAAEKIRSALQRRRRKKEAEREAKEQPTPEAPDVSRDRLFQEVKDAEAAYAAAQGRGGDALKAAKQRLDSANKALQDSYKKPEAPAEAPIGSEIEKQGLLLPDDIRQEVDKFVSFPGMQYTGSPGEFIGNLIRNRHWSEPDVSRDAIEKYLELSLEKSFQDSAIGPAETNPVYDEEGFDQIGVSESGEIKTFGWDGRKNVTETMTVEEAKERLSKLKQQQKMWRDEDKSLGKTDPNEGTSREIYANDIAALDKRIRLAEKRLAQQPTPTEAAENIWSTPTDLQEGEVVVYVDPKKLIDDYLKLANTESNEATYAQQLVDSISRGDTRAEQFNAIRQRGEKIGLAEVFAEGGKFGTDPSFRDGRHRLLWAAEQNLSSVPVITSKQSVANLQKYITTPTEATPAEKQQQKADKAKKELGEAFRDMMGGMQAAPWSNKPNAELRQKFIEKLANYLYEQAKTTGLKVADLGREWYRKNRAKLKTEEKQNLKKIVTEAATNANNRIKQEPPQEPPVDDTDVVTEEDRNGFELADETWTQWLKRKIQDELGRLKTVQESIEKSVGALPDRLNAYMQAELFIGKAGEQIERFKKSTTEFVKSLADAGITIEQFGDYLYALHVKERNARLKEQRDVDNGSGRTDEWAQDIIDNATPEMKKFAEQFRKNVINKRLQLLYRNGLIDKEAYDRLSSGDIYQFYVPLKHSAKPKTGRGFSLIGLDVQRAKGRSTVADNPFIQALVDYEETLVRIEKNKVAKTLLALVLENPNTNLWEVESQRYKPVFDQDGNLQYMNPDKLKDNQIVVKVGGKTKIITVQDEALVRGFNKLGAGKAIPLLNLVNKVLRASFLKYNPEFFLYSNPARDIQFALTGLAVEQNAAVAAKTAKYLPRALRGIWKNVRGKKGNEWSEWYARYKKAGGKVGWLDYMTIEEKTEKLEAEIRDMQNPSKMKRGLAATSKFFEDINEAVESAARLSAFRALIEAGVSEAKAAQAAKNLTVNFNKKGERGPAINSLYLFANAGIQGATRTLSLFKSKRGLAFMGGYAGLGFIQSFINRMIGDDEDEDINAYDKIPPHVRDSNWVFMLPGGKVVTIPLPYGLNVPIVLGQLVEERMFGETTTGEAFGRVLGSVDRGFNPLSSGSVPQFLSPTVTDPLVQIAENKTFFGGPIKPEQPPYQPAKPESELYFDSVRPMSKETTQWFNRMTGGSEEVSGLVDISPEVLDHMIDSIGGGPIKFITNSVTTVTSPLRGTAPDIRNIP